MYWLPANYIETCSAYPHYTSCQPQVLMFLRLLVEFLGYSFDEHFTESNVGTVENHEYDFIIVGAGGAGCVLANRLSEITDWKILLLEAGDEEPAIAAVPALARTLRLSNIDYAYHTQPEFNGYENVSYYWPRGKVMGGSSTINTMWYVRGHKQDYDYWAQLGNSGWCYDDVLPYFKKSEDARDPEVHAKSPHSHSTGGYMRVERFPYEDKNTKNIRDAWKELGYVESDYNSGIQYGTSKLQFTIIHGSHQSSNGAFLRPIRGKRPNLTIRKNSRVVEVIVDPTTKRAMGVRYIDADLKTVSVYAKREVIVSAGAIESPKLLMLSGIGPAADLYSANIEVMKDSPGVGKNLLDHPILYPFTFKLNERSSTLVPVDQIRNDLIYWLGNHAGPLAAIGSMDAITYFEKDYPGLADIQFGFTGFIREAQKVPTNIKFIPTSYYDEVKVSLTLLTPKSKGCLKLNNVDPVLGQPLIYPNYLQNSHDMETIISGIRTICRITKSQVLKANGFQHSTEPESGCEHCIFESDEYFECLVRRTLESAFHIGGTCKMGPQSDPEAVVDSRLKVHGIEGLRVVDGSIMPTLVRANTYAATIMIAEKGSDMIKEDWLSSYRQEYSYNPPREYLVDEYGRPIVHRRA